MRGRPGCVVGGNALDVDHVPRPGPAHVSHVVVTAPAWPPMLQDKFRVLDIDSHIKQVCGVQKEGADFSYNGKWSYQPQVISMAATGECLAMLNRTGNMSSADGAEDAVDEVLAWTTNHFDDVLVRGDSAFDRQALREVIEHHDGFFAFVGRGHEGRPEQAAAIPEEAFRPVTNLPDGFTAEDVIDHTYMRVRSGERHRADGQRPRWLAHACRRV